MNPPPAQSFAPRLLAGPALRLQPDGRLVRLVRDGSEAAFEEIVRRYGKPLQRYAGAIVTNQRAEDVTQDAFSKAFVALQGSEKEIKLKPWLYRIVRNTALNELRDGPPAGAELDDRLPGGEDPLETIERRRQVEALMAGLADLPESQRAAIVMRELEGLSHEQIAKSLGVSGGAVRQSIHRARTALRNGAGMLVPLPVLRALATGIGPDGATAAAGAGAGTGIGLGVKAGVAALIVAGTSVAGIAVQQNHAADAAPDRGAKHRAVESATTGSGEVEPGDDHGGAGSDDHRGHRGGSGDDNSGPGSANSGHGSGGSDDSLSGSNSGPGSATSGTSGSGSSGSDSSGSGSSGSGTSGSGTSGSGSSGSGSGTSGSGSDDLLDP